MPHSRIVLAITTAFLMTAAHAHETPGAEMSAAATRFLDSLEPALRAKATYPFTHSERETWNYVPMVRGGACLKEMAPESRERARDLLKAGLSERGLHTVDAIMALENVLHEMEHSAHRDPELYYVAIFGTPGVDPWGWRFEGHHVSVNYTLVDGVGGLSASPTFMGANPGEVRIALDRGKRALAHEEDAGRKLVKSLTPEQLEIALISNDAPGEILTHSESRVNPLEPLGLAYADMTAEQQAQVVDLLKFYLNRHRTEIADAAYAKLEAAGLGKIQFAWAGGLERGEPHYYRFQGPTFVVEYDNTQNNANHIHTVWRDFDGDFGRDLLRDHLEHDHGLK